MNFNMEAPSPVVCSLAHKHRCRTHTEPTGRPVERHQNDGPALASLLLVQILRVLAFSKEGPALSQQAEVLHDEQQCACASRHFSAQDDERRHRRNHAEQHRAQPHADHMP
jgi:hypothetical protein